MNPVAIWIAAFFTIAVYSFLFGDNPVYRFTEHLFIGLTAANLTVQGFHNVKTQAWQPLITKGELMWLGVIIGGLMLLCRWFKQVEWVSRIPLQFMTGTAMALSLIHIWQGRSRNSEARCRLYRYGGYLALNACCPPACRRC